MEKGCIGQCHPEGYKHKLRASYLLHEVTFQDGFIVAWTKKESQNVEVDFELWDFDSILWQ